MKKMSLRLIQENLCSEHHYIRALALKHTLRFFQFLDLTELFDSIPLFAAFLHNDEWAKDHPEEQRKAAEILMKIATDHKKDPRSSEALMYLFSALTNKNDISDYVSDIFTANGIPAKDIEIVKQLLSGTPSEKEVALDALVEHSHPSCCLAIFLAMNTDVHIVRPGCAALVDFSKRESKNKSFFYNLAYLFMLMGASTPAIRSLMMEHIEDIVSNCAIGGCEDAFKWAIKRGKQLIKLRYNKEPDVGFISLFESITRDLKQKSGVISSGGTLKPPTPDVKKQPRLSKSKYS